MQPSNSPKTIEFFPQTGGDRSIRFSCISALSRLVSENWEEARCQLYDGTFASQLKKRGPQEWAAQAEAIPRSQFDQDVGLFTFMIKLSLNAGRWVSPEAMLTITRAAVRTIPATATNADRIAQMLAVLPKVVGVYHEDDSGPGFSYDIENKSHQYMEELLRSIDPTHAHFLPKAASTFIGIRLDSPTFITDLMRIATSRTTKWRIRVEAAEKICQMHPTGPDKVGIVRALFSIIQDTPRGVRNDSLIAHLRSLLQECASNPDMYVSGADIPVLSQVGGTQAVNLIAGFLSDTNRSIRLSAVQALAQIGGEQAESILRSAQSREPDAILQQAIGNFLRNHPRDFKE